MVGLHPPTPSPLDDGGAYTPSAAQHYLWHRWKLFWLIVKKRAHGHPLYVLINGDLVDGDHHGTTQIVSRHPGIQLDIAHAVADVIWPLKPAGIILVRGTDVHTGPNAAAEEAFGKSLSARGLPVIRTSEGKYSHWKWQGELDGCLIDAAHHGRMGTRVWTKASVSNNLAATIFYEHAAQHLRWPDLAIRSHHHKVVDTHDMQPVRLLQTAAWQLATAFIQRIAPDSIADIGGHLVTCDEGQLTVDTILHHPDPAPIWRPTPPPMDTDHDRGRTARRPPRRTRSHRAGQ